MAGLHRGERSPENIQDVWSFASNYEKLRRGKPKSRLGKKKVTSGSLTPSSANVLAPKNLNLFQGSDSSSKKWGQPVMNKPFTFFTRQPLAQGLNKVSNKENENSSTNPKKALFEPLSFEKSEHSSDIVKLLNNSFIDEKNAVPLSSSYAEEKLSLSKASFSKSSESSDLSTSSDQATYSDFMTCHNFQDSVNKLQTSGYLKTPSKQLTLSIAGDSAIDPLAGICEEDEEIDASNENNEKFEHPTVVSLANQHSFKSDQPFLKDSGYFNDDLHLRHHSSLNELNESHQVDGKTKLHSSLNEINVETKPSSSFNLVSESKFSNPFDQKPNFFDYNILPPVNTKPELPPQDEFKIPTAKNIPAKPPQKGFLLVNNKSYKVLTMMGRGGSSEVFMVLDDLHNIMAIKCVNLANVEDIVAQGYLNEIKLLSKLQDCATVIRMFDYEYIKDSKRLNVVLEIGEIDCSKLLKNVADTHNISISMVTYYWTEMVAAVKEIHSRGIIHSDLKPANFLIVKGRLKLIDFGIASSLQGDMTSVFKEMATGTFNYMSPEAISHSGDAGGYKITYKSDIWSLGCILYNLLYGRTPFSHIKNNIAKLRAIADPTSEIAFPHDDKTPFHILIAMRSCFNHDPKKRPSAADLLNIIELPSLTRQMDSLVCNELAHTFPNLSEEIQKLKNELKQKKRC